MARNLNTVTLSAAMTASQTFAKVSSVTSRLVGDLLVQDTEVMLVNRLEPDDILNSIVGVQRGYAGTRASKHASGAVCWLDRAEYFAQTKPRGSVTASEVAVLPVVVISAEDPKAYRYVNDSWVEISRNRVVNHECVDPDTGFVYLLVDCQNAFQVGEWAVVDPNGLATQVGAASKGRVVIIVETVTASDTFSWGLHAGTYTAALLSSNVTSAADMIAVTGAGDILTSAGGNIIWRAWAQSDPTTLTSPTVGGGIGTVYIDRPYVDGVAKKFTSF